MTAQIYLQTRYTQIREALDNRDIKAGKHAEPKRKGIAADSSSAY